MVEERKGNEKDRKIEAAIHDEDNMINLRVQYLDQRRPKQQNDANLRQRNEKRQQVSQIKFILKLAQGKIINTKIKITIV